MVSSNVLFDFVSFWNSSVIPRRRSQNLVWSCLRDVWRTQDITIVHPKWRVEDPMYISGELAVFPSQTCVQLLQTIFGIFSKRSLKFQDCSPALAETDDPLWPSCPSQAIGDSDGEVGLKFGGDGRREEGKVGEFPLPNPAAPASKTPVSSNKNRAWSKTYGMDRNAERKKNQEKCKKIGKRN